MNVNRNLAVVFDPSAGWLEAVADALSQSGITVVGRTPELKRALALVERHRPALLIADPAGAGLDVIRGASSRVPALKTIALGAVGDAGLVAAAFAAGAAAFVVKTERFDTFGAAIREVASGPTDVRARETSAA